MWSRAAKKQRALRVAGEAINQASVARVVYCYLATWHGKWARLTRNRRVLTGAMGRWRNAKMSAAFNAMTENVVEQKLVRQSTHFVISTMSHSSLNFIAGAFVAWSQHAETLACPMHCCLLQASSP